MAGHAVLHDYGPGGNIVYRGNQVFRQAARRHAG
jgi:hypothetical protein